MKWTVWVQQENGEGTTYITDVVANDKHEAMRLAKELCSIDWGQEDYPPEALRVLGIAKGDIEIVAWEDYGEGSGCEYEEE